MYLQSNQPLVDGLPTEYLSGLVGLSSLPRDHPYEDVDACLEPDNAVEVEGETETPSECIPVKGALTVYATVTSDEKKKYGGLAPSDEEKLRQAILDKVKYGMDEDLYVAPGHIRKASYIYVHTS